METNTEVRVRVSRYKSLRHYGGREITTISYIVKAKYLFSQRDNTELVELLEGCDAYPKGKIIAVLPINFNV